MKQITDITRPKSQGETRTLVPQRTIILFFVTFKFLISCTVTPLVLASSLQI